MRQRLVNGRWSVRARARMKAPRWTTRRAKQRRRRGDCDPYAAAQRAGMRFMGAWSRRAGAHRADRGQSWMPPRWWATCPALYLSAPLRRAERGVSWNPYFKMAG